jgi:hypothetical protein
MILAAVGVMTYRAPSHESCASRLRNLARERKVLFRYPRHALEEMAKDDIVKIDIENMLRRCKVTMVELDGRNEETWRAQGADTDGRVITAIVVVYEEEK